MRKFIIAAIFVLFNFSVLYGSPSASSHSDSFLNDSEVVGTSDLAFKNFYTHLICNPTVNGTIPVGNGTIPSSLKFYKVIYLYSNENKLDEFRPRLNTILTNSDNILDLNAKLYRTNLHFNFEVDKLCNPIIYSMKANVGNLDLELQKLFGVEYNSSKFLIFYDGVGSDCGVYSGIFPGNLEYVPGFALIYYNCWSERVTIHELFHSVSAVSFLAPNSDFTYHLKDSLNDVMSYRVGGNCTKTFENSYLYELGLLADCWQKNYLNFSNNSIIGIDGKEIFNIYNSVWLNHNIVYKVYFGIKYD